MWEVIVENVGSVYCGSNGFEARQWYGSYVRKYRPFGCDWYADVTMIHDGEIVWEYSDPSKGEEVHNA